MTTETSHQKNAPVQTHRDGSVFAKVWENQASDGRAFHTVTFGKTYTDSNGQPQETQGFNGVDVLKVQQLAQEAYRTVQHMRQIQVDQNLAQSQLQNGLQAQRDTAMTHAAPNQAKGADQTPIYQPNQTPSQ